MTKGTGVIATEPLWNEHVLRQSATVHRLVPSALRPFSPEEVAGFKPVTREHDLLYLTVPDSLEAQLSAVTELVRASAGRSHLWSPGGLLLLDDVRRWAFHKGFGRVWAIPSAQTLDALHLEGGPPPVWPSDKQTGQSQSVLTRLDPPDLRLARRLALVLGVSFGELAVKAIGAALMDCPGRWTQQAAKEWEGFVGALDDLAASAVLEWARR
jgi:hypothetical protein